MNRIRYIDVYRGLGIILVVFGHVLTGSGFFRSWIYSFHMMMFFFLSGYLCDRDRIRKKPWAEYIAGKMLSILFPALLFGILCFCYWLAVERHFRAFDLIPYWFLYQLFFCEAAVKALCGIPVKCSPEIAMVICLVFLAGFSLGFFPFIPGKIVTFIDAFGWMTAGMAARCRFGDLMKPPERNGAAIVKTVFLLAGTAAAAAVNGKVEFVANEFHDPLLYLTGGFMGTLLMWKISGMISNNRLIEFFGRNTVIILCTHQPAVRLVTGILSVILHMDTDTVRNSYFFAPLICAAVMCAEYLIILFCIGIKKRYGNSCCGFALKFITADSKF